MSAQTPLARMQTRFAAHIRDPARHPAPADVEDRRMAIYRELFYNNIESFLANNFPVIRKLSDDTAWHALVRAFFSEHRARTPLFPELPREFLRYLQEGRGPQPGDPPFLAELAHYEWIELALSLDTCDVNEIEADPGGDLLAGRPVLSPLAWPLRFRFPVHRIRPGYQPASPPAQATHLLACRNRRDEVRFMELNPVSARLVSLLRAGTDFTGRQCLERIAGELRHPDPAKVIEAGSGVLQDLKARDVVLGTRPVS